MVNRIRKAMDERDQGFTLIELLIVIIIVAILAGVGIPLFLNQRQKGVDSGLKQDLHNAALQVETWITENPQSAIVAGVSDPDAATPVTPAAGSSLEGFTASPGNRVSLTAGATLGTYTLTAGNAASSEPTQCLSYVSDAGGLQPAWGAC